MYQICFYVPVEHAQVVKQAMFNAGAGKIGNYEQCSYEVLGIGQFIPRENANPFLGKPGIVETVNELKIEMVCEKSAIKNVVAALKKAHPYETPAYHVLECLNY